MALPDNAGGPMPCAKLYCSVHKVWKRIGSALIWLVNPQQQD
jgi:hypothetical protein